MTPSREGTLRVGDEVLWRDDWGSSPARLARVRRIAHTHGGKHGEPVQEAPWADLTGREYCVDLTNGSWAYASQIDPLPAAPTFAPPQDVAGAEDGVGGTFSDADPGL